MVLKCLFLVFLVSSKKSDYSLKATEILKKVIKQIIALKVVMEQTQVGTKRIKVS